MKLFISVGAIFTDGSDDSFQAHLISRQLQYVGVLTADDLDLLIVYSLKVSPSPSPSDVPR